jgi:CheY-like chemotaxis protein
MTTNTRVLVIDDNRDVADSFAMLLSAFDLVVEVAYGGESGVEAAQSFRPDVAFIDIRMPGIDGFETARRIRALVGDRGPTLVAVSGLGQEKEEALAAAGFDRQLIKPVSPDAIMEVVARTASRRGPGTD